MNRRRADPHPLRQGALTRLDSIRPTFFLAPELEHEIVKLDGIISARVLTSGTDIDEVHVVAAPDRVPKRIVRDIESLLLVTFGIRVDHRRISVVRPGLISSPRVTAPRPQIASVRRVDTEQGRTVVVQLSVKDEVLEGVGQVRPDQTELHAASLAVISAVERLLQVHALELQDVSVVKLSDQQIVVVLLAWTLDEEFLYLVGASHARGDLLETAARATFDALNRKLLRG